MEKNLRNVLSIKSFLDDKLTDSQNRLVQEQTKTKQIKRSVEEMKSNYERVLTDLRDAVAKSELIQINLNICLAQMVQKKSSFLEFKFLLLNFLVLFFIFIYLYSIILAITFKLWLICEFKLTRDAFKDFFYA